MRAMRRHLSKNDLDHWATSFFDALRGPGSRPAHRVSDPLSTGRRAQGRPAPDADAAPTLAPAGRCWSPATTTASCAGLVDDPSAAVPEPGVAEALGRLAGSTA